uniref:ribosomal protein L24 n=1 Tax=Goniotrichopsis reniformis TaxID=468933 RepID=UPI001FCDD940|nr:ribosomal protein L24 [Goniotrichopsis reniformis]UNJ14771.1 ribosomal protein L24 [Goniotrichopsis reniformis]
MKTKIVKNKVHVKVGDTVKVITGKDKGKIGKIITIFFKTSSVIIEGINLKTKHKKATQEGESGSIITKEAPIHSSNVVHYSQKDDLVSRIGYKIEANGSKSRYLIKNNELLT